MSEPYLILPMQPTPNGRLHIGHIAGPYLRADMIARALRRDGKKAIVVCGSDACENWVAYAAQKQGMAPEVFSDRMNQNILNDLHSLQIIPDIWINPISPEHREQYRNIHENLLATMITAETCTKRMERVPRSRSGKYAIGTWIAGKCPACSRNVVGNSCTFCGAGFQPGEIVEPVSRIDGEPPVWIEKESWFAQGPEPNAIIAMLRAAAVPGDLLRIAEEQLNRSGSMVRVSQPGDWGIKSDLVDPDWVLTNTFYAYCLYCAEMAADRLGFASNLLSRESTGNVTALFGKDNAGIGLIAPAVLSHAAMRFRLFDVIVVNYLLHFEGSKCSTSKHHGIWVNEVLANTDIDSDELRLCLSEVDLTEVDQNVSIDQLLITINWLRSWRREVLSPALTGMTGNMDPADIESIRIMVARQAHILSPTNLDTQKAASDLIAWMKQGKNLGGGARAWISRLALLAEPIMPRLASQLWRYLGYQGEVSIENMLRSKCEEASQVLLIKEALSEDALRAASHIA